MLEGHTHGQGHRGHGNPSRGAQADDWFDTTIDDFPHLHETHDDGGDFYGDRGAREFAEFASRESSRIARETGGGRDQTRRRRPQRDMEAPGSGRHRHMGIHDMYPDDMDAHDLFQDMLDPRSRMEHGGMGYGDEFPFMETYGGMSSRGLDHLYMDPYPEFGPAYMGHDDEDLYDGAFDGMPDILGRTGRRASARSGYHPGTSRSSRPGRHTSGPSEWDSAGSIYDRIHEF